MCCFLARAPESLAGGFLVAVAGRALFAVCSVLFEETSVAMVLSGCFTFSPAQWAPPQLNGPVQLHFLVMDKTVD